MAIIELIRLKKDFRVEVCLLQRIKQKGVKMKTLQDKIAIVTGAGHPKGIGYAIAVKLAEQGAVVVVTDLANTEEELTQLVGEIQAIGSEGLAIAVDVTRSEQISACVTQVIEKYGRIDILANNAGVGVGSVNFLECTEQDWDLTLAVNVKGVVNFCKAVLPKMVEQKKGSIVNTGSLSSLRHIPQIPVSYTASKHAVIGITKQIAQEFGAYNIRCNAICPGSVDTQMRDTVMEIMSKEMGVTREQAEEEENAVISLGRAARPEEVGAVVAFLAGDQASYLTGVALPVDGGMFVGM